MTGYLPSFILNGSIYIVPYIMFSICKLGGSICKSKMEIKACNMVFYFLVGNVFFLSLISGSLLEQIGESVTHPKYIPNHLATAVSSQVCICLLSILLSSFAYTLYGSALNKKFISNLFYKFEHSFFCSSGRFLFHIHFSRWTVSILPGGSTE